MASNGVGQSGESIRGLLLALGIGDFNATGIITFMFWSPRSTDPGMPAIIMLTQALQKTLVKMGANIAVTGILDDPTAACLDQVSGPEWLSDSWYEVVRDVLKAKKRGFRFAAVVPEQGATVGMGGLGPLDFLPDVPGGILTYAAAGVAAWYFLIKKKRSA